MTDYDNNKIRRLDLSVLLIFVGLMRRRKAADVADELGLTNSSISHALRRLRDVFGDELFLRRPHGLEPTAYAERIEPLVRQAVDAVQAALADPPTFRPETAEATLRIAASDREIASLIPPTLAKITAEAPGIRFSVLSLPRAASLQGLSDGTLDLALGFFRSADEAYDRHPIRTESYLVVAREGHPLMSEDLTAERYAATKHVLVSTDGSLTGIVDEALAERGLSRRVSLAVPSFLPALSVVADSDFVATLPATLVQRYAAAFRLVFREPPVRIRPFSVSVLSHRRNRKSALHTWVIDAVREAERAHRNGL